MSQTGLLRHMIQISFIKPDYKCICGCCKQSYCERESHTKQKSTRTPTFIVSALSYSLAANITCSQQTALHTKCYIFKCHLRRKISPPKMLEPHWLKSEATREDSSHCFQHLLHSPQGPAVFILRSQCLYNHQQTESACGFQNATCLQNTIMIAQCDRIL